jgi:hypothetical protein
LALLDASYNSRALFHYYNNNPQRKEQPLVVLPVTFTSRVAMLPYGRLRVMLPYYAPPEQDLLITTRCTGIESFAPLTCTYSTTAASYFLFLFHSQDPDALHFSFDCHLNTLPTKYLQGCPRSELLSVVVTSNPVSLDWVLAPTTCAILVQEYVQYVLVLLSCQRRQAIYFVTTFFISQTRPRQDLKKIIP